MLRSLYALALAPSMWTVGAQGPGCQESGGNWYCDKVDAVTYRSFGKAGEFDRVVNMDGCKTVKQAYSGSIAPFDDEITVAFRGPIHLKQFAAYAPAPAAPGKGKRDTGHGHNHAHKRYHEKRSDFENVEKRSDIVITATYNGAVFSWTTDAAEAAGPQTAAANPAPSENAAQYPSVEAPAQPSPSPQPAPAQPATQEPADGQPAQPSTKGAPPISPQGGSAPHPATGGDWGRVGCYHAENQTADGITFLKSYYGPLTYCEKSGTKTASAPATLADNLVPSNQEFTIWSDKKCSGQNGDCGYFNPSYSATYHGFSGSSKAFIFEFSMPHDSCNEGLAPNAPAIWLLNSLVPRTGQYGCSCWNTGCGEFDLFEVLTKGETRMKSTVHDNQSLGSSDWFERPCEGFVKGAVVMDDFSATIALLPDSFEIGPTLTQEQMKTIKQMPKAQQTNLPN